MELETLKAKLMATSQMGNVLDSTARSAEGVADELQNSAAAGELLATGMDSAQDESNLLKRALEQTNRAAVEGAGAANIYAEGLDETVSSSAEAAAASALAEHQIENVGEEALKSAAKTEAFDQSLDDIDGAGVRANLLGISGGLGTVAKVAGAATPAILGVTAALGGLGAVGAGAAVGGIGLTAAGIQSRAEEMAAFSEELETAADAREQLMGNFKSELESATDVLQNAQTEEFAMANMAAAVDIVENGANALAAVQPTIFGLAEGFRETAVAVSPELFGALGSEVEDLAPLLSELDGVVRDLPALITFLGDAAERVGPDLFAFGAAAVDVLGPVTSVGLAISDVLLPPLNATLFVLGGVLGLWELLPAPLQNAAAAFAVAATGAYLLSGAMGVLGSTTFATTLATQGLIAALATLFAPISATAVAIAALIGIAAGLASHFGLLDDAAGVAVGTWNALVGAFQWTINTAWQLYDALGILGPILFPGIAAVEGLIFVLKLLGDLLGWLGGVAGDFFGWLAEQIEMLEEKLDGFIEFIDGVTNAAGLDGKVKAEQEKSVDLSAAKIGGNSDGDNDDGSDGSNGRSPPPAAPAATTGGGGSSKVDMSGSTFVGSNESDMKQWVREAVEEANTSDQQRQDAQGV
jgi:hypothetical protein